jgi:hypothetical protein
VFGATIVQGKFDALWHHPIENEQLCRGCHGAATHPQHLAGVERLNEHALSFFFWSGVNPTGAASLANIS